MKSIRVWLVVFLAILALPGWAEPAPLLGNAGFEGGVGADGAPTSWTLFSKLKPDTQKVELVDGGHEGKGVLMQDDDTEASVGLAQVFPAEPGKTYRFSCWKKGSPLALYLKSLDATGKQIKYKAQGAQNTNADAFEEFVVEDTATDDAVSVQVIIYFAKASRGTAVVDDAKLVKVE